MHEATRYLLDRERLVFRDAIRKWRSTGAGTVLDVGCGPGLLSLWVAQSGYAQSIDAVEDDPRLLAVAHRTWASGGVSDAIESHLVGDLCGFQPRWEVDLLIHDGLGAWCIRGESARIAAAYRPFLAPGSSVLPSEMYNTLVAIEIPALPEASVHWLFEDTLQQTRGTELTSPAYAFTQSFEVDYSRPAGVDIQATAYRDGAVNALRLQSSVLIGGNTVGPWTKIAPPLVLPVEPSVVRRGDALVLSISGIPSVEFGGYGQREVQLRGAVTHTRAL